MLKGQEGQSIKGITKTGTSGVVDTYTITFNDSTIQSTYTLVGNIPANNGSDFWIGDVNHVNGVWYPSTVVSSDKYGMGDRCYSGGQSTSGSREYLQGGYIRDGSNAGLSFLNCVKLLGDAGWGFLSAD